MAQTTFLGAPFLIGSGIRLAYNAMLYYWFSSVEEVGQQAAAKPTRTRVK